MTSRTTDQPRVPENHRRSTAFPPERRLVLDTLHLGHHKPMMHGLLEVDVTRARRTLAAYRARTGTTLSFSAFVLTCLGRAVAAHPEVHALRDWRGQVVLFEHVDATAIIEVEVEGRPFALAHLVRGVDRRSVEEITAEIRAVQRSGMRSMSAGLRVGAGLFLRLPGIVRRGIYRALLRSPDFARRHTGTLLVSSVGMFTGGIGWGMSAPGIHNLSVVIGGVAPRPAVSGDESGPREVLCLTVSANHELVDGAPLARFVRHLTRLLESAELLPEFDAWFGGRKVRPRFCEACSASNRRRGPGETDDGGGS